MDLGSIIRGMGDVGGFIMNGLSKVSPPINNFVQAVKSGNYSEPQQVQAAPKIMPVMATSTPTPLKSAVLGIQDTAPKPTVVPTASSEVPQANSDFIYNYTPYISDQNEVNKSYPQGLPQPPPELSDIIRQVSPEDATRSAILKLTESRFDMNPKDFTGNRNGTIDRGTNMINSGTFNWMWNQQGNKSGTYPYRDVMQKNGINSFDDMKDPMKNELMMDLIRKTSGYGQWYGPGDRGFDLNQ